MYRGLLFCVIVQPSNLMYSIPTHPTSGSSEKSVFVFSQAAHTLGCAIYRTRISRI